jgi:hypothetical protein
MGSTVMPTSRRTAEENVCVSNLLIKLSFVATWIELEHIKFIEINQTQKDNYPMIFSMWKLQKVDFIE